MATSLGLLHSTDPATPHLSLHARSDAPVADVDAAFYEDRTLLRHTTIRRTVFAMPLDVVPLAHNAVNGPLVAKLRSNLTDWIAASPDTDEPADRFLETVEAAVLAHLHSAGPAAGTSLATAVAGLRVRFDPMPGKAHSKPTRITSKVLEILAADGRIARGRPTGSDFTSGAWTWETMTAWLGRPEIEVVDAATALERLIDHHLGAFGPATVTDLAWWTGTTKGRIRAALETIEADEVDCDGIAEPGFVRRHDALDAPVLGGTVALLPGLDSTTMGWKQREWYVDDRPGTGLFDRNGNAGPTVWVDGRVVGSWTQRADSEIAVRLLEDVGADAERAIDAEVERTMSWLGDVRVKWRYPTPITKALLEA